MTKKKSFKNQNITPNSNVSKPLTNKPVKKVTTSSRSVSGIKGLINLGNTCYFNSMLQMLINSPFFLSQLKKYCTTEQNIVAKLHQREYELVLKTSDVSLVEKEILLIWESEKESISPASLRSALLQHKDFKAHFNGFNEQDSHEVFLMVLNIIKEAQIKRIRGAVLDYFNARKMSSSIDDDTKNKIKEMSAVVEKQTLVNNLFGLVIGSNLKCQSCGELRMRFDEVFHITPVFVAKNDSDDSKRNDDKEDSGLVILKPKNQAVVNEKMSKHQMKRQKRIEKKSARNKKSVQRNIECSPEEMHGANDVIMNGNVNEDDSDINDCKEEEEEEQVESTIMIGGNDEEMDDNFVIQQLIYDAVTEESLTRKKSMSSLCSSSNGSMVARKNDSSRVSISSLTSSVEDVLCQQFSRDMSVHEGYIDPDEHTEDTKEVDDNYDESMDNNSCRDVMDDDSDVDKMSSAGNIIRANLDRVLRVDVCGDGVLVETVEEEMHQNNEDEMHQNNDEDMQQKDEDKHKNDEEREHENDQELEQKNKVLQNSAVIVDSYSVDRSKQFLQSAFSAALETHQDRLNSCYGQKKVAFDSETDLDRALNRFTMPMFLENIVCDNCSGQKHKVQTNHFKTDVICHLPQILPFYISRFKQCAERNRTKNTQVYSYPLVLNLSSQCSRFANFSSESSPVLYRLFGIIEHIGARINSGHYVSYVSGGSTTLSSSSSSSTSLYPSNILSDLSHKYDLSRYNQDYQWQDTEDHHSDDDDHNHETNGGQWFRISDSQVESVSRDTVMRVQAFMLFYARIQ